jgi:hypothetical protein
MWSEVFISSVGIQITGEFKIQRQIQCEIRMGIHSYIYWVGKYINVGTANKTLRRYSQTHTYWWWSFIPNLAPTQRKGS